VYGPRGLHAACLHYPACAAPQVIRDFGDKRAPSPFFLICGWSLLSHGVAEIED